MGKTIGPGSVARLVTSEVVIGPDSVRRTVVSRVVIGPDGTRHGVSSGLMVSIAPAYLSGSSSRKGTSAFSIGTATATVVGGTAPFNYVWTPDSGFSATPSSSATPSTTIVSPPMSPGDEESGALTVTVTDANGATATAPSIGLFASNYGELS